MAILFTVTVSQLSSYTKWDLMLMEAVENSHFEKVKMAVKKGANVNVKGHMYGTETLGGRKPGEYSVLHMAIGKSKSKVGFEIVKFLIKQGADINDNDNIYSLSPLMASMWRQDKRLFDFLIKNKNLNIDLKAKNHVVTALILASGYLRNSYYALELIRHGANVNITSETKTALHEACNYGRIERVRALVEAGADINAVLVKYSTHMSLVGNSDKSKDELTTVYEKQSPNNYTPLMLSIIEGKSDVALYLIEKGANIHLKMTNGDTALSLAKKEGNEKIIKLLRKK